MNAAAFDDINTAQLRKLAHACTAVRGEPWTPALGCVSFAANFDRQCGTQYCLDLALGEGFRLRILIFFGTFTRQPVKGLR